MGKLKPKHDIHVYSNRDKYYNVIKVVLENPDQLPDVDVPINYNVSIDRVVTSEIVRLFRGNEKNKRFLTIGFNAALLFFKDGDENEPKNTERKDAFVDINITVTYNGVLIVADTTTITTE